MYEILLELMKKHGITSYKLAKDLGIAQATLSRWKTGNAKPSLEMLKRIAAYFNVSVDYLAFGYNQIFGSALEELRSRKGVSHQQLADLCNEKFPPKIFEPQMYAATIRAMEEGVAPISYDDASKFAYILDASPDEILVSYSSAVHKESGEKQRLSMVYDKLNEEGKRQLLDYADLLSSNSKYSL